MTKDEIQAAIISALIQHAAYTVRLSSASVNEILKQFDKLSNEQINILRDLLEDLTQAELTALSGAKYTTPALKEVKSTIDDWMTQITAQLQPMFVESAVALTAYEASYIYRLADKEAPAISGKSLYSQFKDKPYANGLLIKDIFPNISSSLRKKIDNVIRDGISQGQTTQQIVQRIKGNKTTDGLLEASRKDIATEVITARAHISSEAYKDTWKAIGFDYVIDVATLDFRTTKLCSGIDHRVQKLDSRTKSPPYHRRCRTIQIGCDKDGNIDGLRPFVSSDKPVGKIPKDQREGIIGQVDANTSYPEWFSRQDEDHQKAWLGPSRFKLYRDAKYPITKFIDPLSGEMFTLAELKELDKKTFDNLGL